MGKFGRKIFNWKKDEKISDTEKYYSEKTELKIYKSENG